MSDAQPPYQPHQQPPPGYPGGPAAPPPVQDNPYGGWTTAPAYGGPGGPGSLPWVESRFGPVATFGDRVIALLIDTAYGLVFLLPMGVGIVLLVAGLPKDASYDEYGDPSLGGGNGGLVAAGVIVMVLSLLASMAFQLWNRVWRMGRTGQSLGKKHAGLLLVDDRSGRPVGAGMCFVRELVSGAVNQVLWLSYLWMLWDENRQTVADKAAHSTVIRLPKG